MGIKRTVFEHLIVFVPLEYQLRLFQRLGIRLGVQSFVSSGHLGVFEGSIQDRAVLSSYTVNKNWERTLQSVLADNIFHSGTGTYVDVGANIGLTIIPVARTRQIKAIGFEPEEVNFRCFQRNIYLNGVEEYVTAHQIALYSSECEIDFELSEINMGDHRIRKRAESVAPEYFAEGMRETKKVQAKRLDDVLTIDSMSRPVAAKMDCQGSEVRILKGGAKFFSSADYVILEYWPYGLRRVGDSEKEIIEFSRQFPYAAVFDSDYGALPELQPIEKVMPLLKSLPRNSEDTSYLDLILSRWPNLKWREEV